MLEEYLALKGADNSMKIPEVAKASGESRSGENHYSYGNPDTNGVHVRWKNTPKDENGKYIIPHLKGNTHVGLGEANHNFGKSERMRQVVMARWAKK
jgi:hypothetical protein